MVKPLNKEWELFGQRYRVPGAKGDKVDCNACQKQVSAAVNRLQSHLRVCPARAALPVSLLGIHHHHHAASPAHQLAAAAPRADAGVNAVLGDLGGAATLHEDTMAAGNAGLAAAVASSLAPAEPSTTANGSVHAGAASMHAEAAPPVKKPRLSPSQATRDRAPRLSPSTSIDDLLLSGLSPPPPIVAGNPAAYAKKRLEIEEKRLELELKRDKREARREQLQLEILEAQARKERMLAEKEAFEAKVLLALSRKQLRDQGVDQEEIDRILPVPVDPSASESFSSQQAAQASESGATVTQTAGATTMPALTSVATDGQTASESEATPESAERAPSKDFSLVDRASGAAEC